MGSPRGLLPAGSTSETAAVWVLAKGGLGLPVGTLVPPLSLPWDMAVIVCLELVNEVSEDLNHFNEFLHVTIPSDLTLF